MSWDNAYALSIMPDLMFGALVTMLVTAGCAIIALLGGLLLAIFGITGGLFARTILRILLEMVRGVPILVFLYLGFYALPEVGILIPAYAIGIGILGIIYAAYCSEVYRGALITIPSGIKDACFALGLSPFTVWTSVLIPIAVRKSLPALANYVVILYKQTSFLFAIGVPVLFARAQVLGSESFRYLEPYTITGLFYLIINIPVIIALKHLESQHEAARY